MTSTGGSPYTPSARSLILLTNQARAIGDHERSIFDPPIVRVLVTGARLWADFEEDVVPILESVLSGLQGAYLPRAMELMHGEAPGVDQLAETVVHGPDMFWGVLRVPITDLDRRSGHRMAPIIRDRRMVDQGAQLCIGVPHPAAKTRGTWQTMQFAVDAGIPTYFVSAMPDRPPAGYQYNLAQYHGLHIEPDHADAA